MEDIVPNKAACAIARIAREHKGEDTIAIDLAGSCDWTDCFVITTARSSSHLKGLVQTLRDELKKQGIVIRHDSKRSDGQSWVLIDCGFMVIHIMERETREFYALEDLWFNGKIIFSEDADLK